MKIIKIQQKLTPKLRNQYVHFNYDVCIHITQCNPIIRGAESACKFLKSATLRKISRIEYQLQPTQLSCESGSSMSYLFHCMIKDATYTLHRC